MTECTQPSFFDTAAARWWPVSTAARSPPKTEQRTASCGSSPTVSAIDRQPGQVEHSVRELVSQRVYGLALGYEDLNDHDQCVRPASGKQDLGKQRPSPRPRQPRRRQEHPQPPRPRPTPARKAVTRRSDTKRLLISTFNRSRASPSASCFSTARPSGRALFPRLLRARYLPLYIFAGDQLLCARLRPSNIDASEGSLEEVQRIVAQLRRAWPEAEILLRADSGFCRDEIMSWCEANGVDYLFGLARTFAAPHQARMKLARRRRVVGKADGEGRKPALRGDLAEGRASAGATALRDDLARGE